MTKKWRKHGHRRYSFDIRFHDGDVLRGIGSHFLHRMREVFSLNIVTLPPPLEYRNLWKVEDGPAPPVSAFEADGSSGTLVNMQTESLEGLFTNRCRKCSQCNRPSCGACIGCRFNETNRRVPRQICVQTMCVDIPRVNKCQTSPWLPPDWSYYFEENQSNPEYEGLFIFRPKFMKSYCYKSYETAQSTAQTKFKGYNENHCFNFYREVGLRGNREELLSRPTTQNEPMHLARIKEAEQMSHTVNTGNKEWKHQKRCRKCWRCNRSRCKNCSMCRSGNHLQFGCIRNVCLRSSITCMLRNLRTDPSFSF